MPGRLTTSAPPSTPRPSLTDATSTTSSNSTTASPLRFRSGNRNVFVRMARGFHKKWDHLFHRNNAAVMQKWKPGADGKFYLKLQSKRNWNAWAAGAEAVGSTSERQNAGMHRGIVEGNFQDFVGGKVVRKPCLNSRYSIGTGNKELSGFSVSANPNSPELDPNKPVVLFLSGSHGSAEEYGADIAKSYHRKDGVKPNFVALNYRGFGNSAHKERPNETSMTHDGFAMVNHLIEQGFSPENIVIHGYSMGAHVAARLQARVEAAGHQFKGVVYDRPMSSATGAAKSHYAPETPPQTYFGRFVASAKASFASTGAKFGVGSMSARKTLEKLQSVNGTGTLRSPTVMTYDTGAFGDRSERMGIKLGIDRVATEEGHKGHDAAMTKLMTTSVFRNILPMEVEVPELSSHSLATELSVSSASSETSESSSLDTPPPPSNPRVRDETVHYYPTNGIYDRGDAVQFLTDKLLSIGLADAAQQANRAVAAHHGPLDAAALKQIFRPFYGQVRILANSPPEPSVSRPSVSQSSIDDAEFSESVTSLWEDVSFVVDLEDNEEPNFRRRESSVSSTSSSSSSVDSLVGSRRSSMSSNQSEPPPNDPLESGDRGNVSQVKGSPDNGTQELDARTTILGGVQTLQNLVEAQWPEDGSSARKGVIDGFTFIQQNIDAILSEDVDEDDFDDAIYGIKDGLSQKFGSESELTYHAIDLKSATENPADNEQVLADVAKWASDVPVASSEQPSVQNQDAPAPVAEPPVVQANPQVNVDAAVELSSGPEVADVSEPSMVEPQQIGYDEALEQLTKYINDPAADSRFHIGLSDARGNLDIAKQYPTFSLAALNDLGANYDIHDDLTNDEIAATIVRFMQANPLQDPEELSVSENQLPVDSKPVTDICEQSFKMTPDEMRAEIGVLMGLSKEDASRVTMETCLNGNLGNGLELNLSTDGQVQRMNVRFFPAQKGHKGHLELGLIKLKAGSQGKGSSRKMFEGMLNLMKKTSLNSMSMEANITVGGYLWGRMGFHPEQRAFSQKGSSGQWGLGQLSGWLGQFVQAAESQSIKSGKVSIQGLKTIIAQLNNVDTINPRKMIRQLAGLDTPIALKDLTNIFGADRARELSETAKSGNLRQLTLGKALLLGTHWDASFDVKEDMGFMKRYVLKAEMNKGLSKLKKKLNIKNW